MWQHNVTEPYKSYLTHMQTETLQALRCLYGFSSYYTWCFLVHERNDLSHSHTTGKKKHLLAMGSFLNFNKVMGGDKRMENNGCSRVLG